MAGGPGGREWLGGAGVAGSRRESPGIAGNRREWPGMAGMAGIAGNGRDPRGDGRLQDVGEEGTGDGSGVGGELFGRALGDDAAAFLPAVGA